MEDRSYLLTKIWIFFLIQNMTFKQEIKKRSLLYTVAPNEDHKSLNETQNSSS